MCVKLPGKCGRVLFFVGTHLRLLVPMTVGPVGGPWYPSCSHFCSQLPGAFG